MPKRWIWGPRYERGCQIPNPAAFSIVADYFDGASARVQRVAVTLTDDSAALIITPPEQQAVNWPLTRLRALTDQAHQTSMILTLAGDPVARVIVTDQAAIAVLRRRCATLWDRAPVTGVGRLIGWGAGAVASVALIIGILIPLMANQLAELLPPEGEKALGDTTFEQVRRALGQQGAGALRICDGPKGTRDLDRMQARLTDQLDLPYPLTLRVLHGKPINAFALPGGYVVFFDGLFASAKSPDEVAAVFAHELGHVVARDPTRIALRSAGSIGVLGLLFGDFSGGGIALVLAEQLVQANYTQAAEAAADRFAHDRLRAVGLRPDALAALFRTLRDQNPEGDRGQSGIVSHFSSHPALGDRIAAAEAASLNLGTGHLPALTNTQWRDLKRICRE